jgi:manganese transport protein
MKKWLKLGPATLVSAAFIGPGTVVAASLAGANYGYALLWAFVFSIAATMILQEMTLRLSIYTQEGLGENLRRHITHPMLNMLTIGLVVFAIVVGNAAYQGGNLAGASAGLVNIYTNFQMVVMSSDEQLNTSRMWSLVVGILAIILFLIGNYRFIERLMFVLVALMSLAFISTMIITKPNFFLFFDGLMIPRIPDGATLTVIALIGTTVVPYNLFLHSSAAVNKWPRKTSNTEVIESHLRQGRRDLLVSIPIGGLISIAILSTAASAFFNQQLAVTQVSDIASSLKPIFGSYAQLAMGIGLFAAGLSSSLTAPLAAGFALCGILGLDKDIQSNAFRFITLVVLACGMFISSSGIKPLEVIWMAQVANGLLLPILTIFLILIMNSEHLGRYKNNWKNNLMGALVLIVILILSAKSLLSAFGQF